ncbi:MAG: protoporphyrinogen oxidase [Cytophagales bacterium]|nr:MAG: protoporphyrinogen oxidase [Cytophagales bacterium]
MKTIIIGAGISGLALAYFLEKLKKPYVLLESTAYAGGVIKTLQKGDYQIELGPNSLLVDAAMEAFLDEIGIAPAEILPAAAVSNHRYIFKNQKYKTLPTNPLKLFLGNYFSWAAKKAILREWYVPAGTKPNETLSEFFTRRFHKEIVDYALAPFVSGVYAGNPDTLLIKKTFPMIYDLEQNYGSIIKGMSKQKKGAGRRKTISFMKGMQTLPQTLAQHLHHIMYEATVDKITKTANNNYLVSTSKGDFEASNIVLTAPAHQCQFLEEIGTPSLMGLLDGLHYPPMVVVYTAYKRQEVAHALNGFGGLNPHKEHLFTLGSIWTSSVFPNRCPKDEVLLTTFIGGSLHAAKTQLSNAEILENVQKEHAQCFRIKGLPTFQHLYRWQKAIPQYEAQSIPLHEAFEEWEKENIYVCANWKDGVSIPDCIQKARKLADRL